MTTQTETQSRELKRGETYQRKARVTFSSTSHPRTGIVLKTESQIVTVVDERIQGGRDTPRYIDVYRFDCGRDGSNPEPKYLGQMTIDERNKRPFRFHEKFIQQHGGTR
ncbi:MAG: hypothetical protein KKD18_05230 [Nanoarchaeota archaeon]|nr:hypothetical protein [Nanoarchaeota archaeon]MBU0977792.1 hypothetical protein [Nanoarchaeota archaeon]